MFNPPPDFKLLPARFGFSIRAGMKSRTQPFRLALSTATMLLATVLVPSSRASENVPHTPFAEWAEVPERGQLVTRLTYQESEAYYIWAGNTRYKVDWRKGGEHYGIDINQGFLSLQYGLTERWAADLAVGYTTAGWRFFSNFSTNGSAESATGLMDLAFGVR